MTRESSRRGGRSLGGHRRDQRALARAGGAGQADDLGRAVGAGAPSGVRQLPAWARLMIAREQLGECRGPFSSGLVGGLVALAHRVDDHLHRRAGVEDLGNAAIEKRLDVVLRNDAAHVDGNVRTTDGREFLEQLRDEHQMRVAHHRCGHAIDVLVTRGDRQRPGGLPEAGVDDVNAAVAQGASDQFDAAVVAIEAHLAQQDTRAMREIAAAVDLLQGGGRFGRWGRHAAIIEKDRRAVRSSPPILASDGFDDDCRPRIPD